MDRILFCHGLESTPQGRKVTFLREHGIDVVAPDFRGMGLAARVDRLRPLLGEHPHRLLVGSSYGGITALCAAIQHVEAGGTLPGLILLAPALARAEPPADRMRLYPPCRTRILHGVRDDVVPIGVSRSFAEAHPEVELTELDDEHALAGSLDAILDAIRAA